MRHYLFFLALLLALCVPWNTLHAQFINEDFESMTANAVPTGWDNSASTTSTKSYSPLYVWGVYAYGGNQMIRLYNYYVQSGVALINMPAITLPAADTCLMTFKYSHRADCGEFSVKISTDSGANFTTLKSFAKNGTNSKDDPGTFVDDTINLTPYTGQYVIIQIYANANYGNGAIYIDDIEMFCPGYCGTFKTITTTTTTAKVTANWTLRSGTTTDTRTGYEVRISSNSDPDAPAVDSATITNPDATSYAFAHLERDSQYYLHLRINCDTSGYSDWLTTTAQTLPLTTDACPAATNLTAYDITTTSATASWNASTADYVGTYDLYYSTTPVDDFSSVTPQLTGITDTTATLSGLTQYTDYYFYVRVNCNGYGHDEGDAWSLAGQFQTLAPCNVPTNIAFENRSKHSVMMSWTATAQSSNYRYFLTTDDLATPGEPTAKGIYADSALIEGLTPATTYYLHIANQCGKKIGISPWIKKSFTTPDACLAPVSVAFVDSTLYTLTLNWTPNPLADPTDTYDLIIDTTQLDDAALLAATPTVAGIADTTYTFDTLFRNTTYYAYIRTNCGGSYTNYTEVVGKTPDYDPECGDKTLSFGTSSGFGTGLVNPNYDYGYGQQLITKNELTDMAGLTDAGPNTYTITAISFQVTNAYASYTPNWKIYLGHTSEETLSTTYVPYSNLTHVATINTPFTQTGWCTIQLDTPFLYDGTSNLVLAIANQTGSYCSSLKFAYGSSSNMSVLRTKDNNSSYGDPSYTTSGTKQYFRMNVRFTFCEPATPCPVVDLVTVPETEVRDTSILMTWTRGTGEMTSSYDVMVSDHELDKPDSAFLQNEDVIIIRDVTDTFVTVTGLTPDTRYYGYVRVSCKLCPYDDGVSEWKRVEPMVTTEKSTLKPYDFRKIEITSSKITLQWINRGGYDKWQIIRYNGATSSYDTLIANVQGDTCRYTYNDLTPYTNYNFQIRTIGNNNDTSDFADNRPECRSLNIETNLNVIYFEDFELIPNTIIHDTTTHTVYATARKGQDLSNVSFQFLLSDYVDRCYADGVRTQVNYHTADFTSPVTFTVVAEDTNIRQDWIITLTEEDCATPYSVAAANIARRSADITWKLGDSLATSFDLVLSDTAVASIDTISATAIQAITANNDNGNCSYTLQGLHRNTAYYVYLRTNCGTGTSAWRDVTFTTADLNGEAACPDVTNITVANITNTTATVNWTASTGDYATTYDLYYSTTAVADPATEITTPSLSDVADTTAALTGLAPYTTYHVYVRANCNDGLGNDDGLSNWAETSFLSESDCEYPRNVAATLTGKTTARLDWTDANGQNTAGSSYDYAYNTTGIEPTSDISATTDGYADINGLAAETKYFLFVRRNCGSGNVSPWYSDSVTTPPTMPAVINLAASNVSYNGFDLSWQSDTARFANETAWSVLVYNKATNNLVFADTVAQRSVLVYGKDSIMDETTEYHVMVSPAVAGLAAVWDSINVTTIAYSDCQTDNDITSATTLYGPIYSQYYSSYTTYIYTAAELKARGIEAGKIVSIAYYQTYCQYPSDAAKYQKTTTVWMANTTKESFSNTTDWMTTGLTQVVDQKTVDFNKNGEWVTLTLDTPYEWDGVSNLAIAVLANGTNYCKMNFASKQAEYSAVIASPVDATITVTGGVPSGSDHRCDANRPIVQLCFEPQTCIKPHQIAVNDITTTSATATWLPGATESAWSYFLATEELADSLLNDTTTMAATENRVALDGLTKETTYLLYVRANCSATDSSRWSHQSFTTLPTCGAPAALSAINTDANQATFVAGPGAYGTPCSYDYRYWAEDIDTTTVLSQGDTLVANGLIADKTYHWQVRANCGTADGLSQWTTGPDVAVCGIVYVDDTHPFVQNFETGGYSDLTAIYPCWQSNHVAGSGTKNWVHTVYDISGRSTIIYLPDMLATTLTNLVLPQLYIPEANQYEFSFWMYRQSVSKTNEGVKIFVNTTPDTIGASSLAYIHNDYQFEPAENARGWYQYFVTIPNAGYQYIIVQGISEYGSSMYMDDFAVSSIKYYTLSKSAADTNGSVAMSCLATDTLADGRIVNRSQVTLTATPKYGYRFASWSNGETANPLTVAVTSDTNLVASFEETPNWNFPHQFDTTLGTVDFACQADDTLANGRVWDRATVQLTANANSGAIFNSWSNGETANPLTVYVTSDTVVTPIYDTLSHRLNVVVSAVEGQYDLGDVEGYGTFKTATQHQIAATDITSHYHVIWNDGNTDNPRTVTMPSHDVTYTATFVIDTHTVTLTVNDTTLGSVTGGGDYAYNSAATLTATPASSHSIFKGWFENDVMYSKYTQIITNVICDMALEARFVPDTHYVCATPNDNAMGSVAGCNYYAHGDTATLVATAEQNYRFVNWSNGATTDTISFVVENDSSLTAIFDLNTLNVYAVSNDNAMGTVTGSGTYIKGTTATITATAAAHYHFVGWSNGSTDAQQTINVASDTVLVATFAIDRHNVSVSSNNAALGTAGGDIGDWDYGTEVTIIATPASSHSTFTGWYTTGGTLVSTNNPMSIIVESDTMLVAYFNLDKHLVTVSANNSSMGSVTGGNMYNHGDTATLVATANPNYRFVKWSNGATTDTISFVVEENISLTAIFELDTRNVYAVSNDNAMGTVTGSGNYTIGTTATINATPAAHYHFVNWSNGSTDAQQTFTVTCDTVLVATFAIDRHNVSIAANDAALGTVSGDIGDWDYGTEVTIIATPASEHMSFVGWYTNGGTLVSTNNPMSIIVESDTMLVAHFQLDKHLVTVSANNSSMGSVTGGNMYNHGDTATLVATANPHYHFIGWSNGAMSPTLRLIADQNYSLIANFAIDQHTVATSVNDISLGTVTGAGTYDYGTQVTLTATPAEHAQFTQWSDGSTLNPRTIALTADTHFTAQFEHTNYTLTLSANSHLYGTTTGAGSYTYGTQVMIKAIANDCYHFTAWSDGVTDAIRLVSVTSDSTIQAIFAEDVVRTEFDYTACDSYLWYGTNINTPGEYEQHLLTVKECDSTVVMHLTLNHSNSGVDVQEHCDTYVWINGATYTASNNTDQFTITNQAGCDSVVTLQLTMNLSDTTAFAAQASRSYNWDGREYTATGDYAYTYQNIYGCDSVVNMHLTIVTFAAPEIVSVSSQALMLTHYPDGSAQYVDYIDYRWYRDGELVASGSDNYAVTNGKLNGCYYVEVPTDETKQTWLRSNEICISNPEGIDDINAIEVSLGVSPNPVAHGAMLTITTNLPETMLQGTTLTIFDRAGRTISSMPMTQPTVTLTAGQTAGLYMIQLTTADGSRYVQKVVVR